MMPTNAEIMVVFQKEMQRAERMVRVNMWHWRNLGSYCETPAVRCKRRDHLLAARGWRKKSCKAAERWAYFAKEKRRESSGRR